MMSDAVGLADVPQLGDLLLTLRKVRLRISSSSMSPTLNPGDEILVEPLRSETLRAGDLILFRRDHQLICHRVVEASAGPLLTRGDATSSPGEAVHWEQVLGKVVEVRKRNLWAGITITLQRVIVRRFMPWLTRLQQLNIYPLLMRPLIRPFLSYHLGVAEGSLCHQWKRLDTPIDIPRLEPARRPHLLLAKWRGSVAGFAHLVFRQSRWRCEHVCVRFRYRGLGIERSLATWAHLLCDAKSHVEG